jgi:hypothetical protein
MFKECLAQAISPPATFLIIRYEQKTKQTFYLLLLCAFRILSFYIKQSSSLVERRDLKDLQV